MNKIVIIGYSPLSQKQNVILGIDKLVENAIVEYWDISSMVGDQSRLPEINIKNVIKYRIESKKEFCIHISKLNGDTFVIWYMYINPQTYSYYKELAKRDCVIATVVTGALPTNANNPYESYLKRFFRSKHKYKSILSFVVDKLFSFKIRSLRPFDYYLYAGANVSFSSFYPNPRTKKVPINDFDFQMIRNTRPKKLLKTDYILFIDQYEPFHPDSEIIGVKTVTPEKYYNEINNYFDIIEKRYGLPVVISAHPKAEKYHEYNFFNGREVIFGHTDSLSYYANFVITHYSTAVSFPVIYKKPILFIYTMEMMNVNPSCRIIINMSETLNCNVVNISDSEDSDVFKVNEIDYNKYLYSFLTNPESCNRDNYDIIMDLLQ